MELTLKTKCYVTTQVGTQVVRQSTKGEWEAYGEILRRVEEAKQWAIGDWLVDGKTHYGDGLYKRAAEITGLDPRYLENLKQISDRFEITHRCVDLTWAHHRETASLKQIVTGNNGLLSLSEKEPDKEKIAELLTLAEKKEWSVVELREQVREHKEWQRQHIAAANEPEKYAVIYADPPWEYNDKRGDDPDFGAATAHYPVMGLDEIRALPEVQRAATDCVLFLWATSPLLREALDVVASWGFDYKASMVWDKVDHNVGHYVSVRHELLLIATKGQPPKVPKLVDSVYSSKRTEHSRKPAYFRELIDELYPDGKRIELFCRGPGGKGWDTWGNEA